MAAAFIQVVKLGLEVHIDHESQVEPISIPLSHRLSAITENWILIKKRYEWLSWTADSIFSEICGVSSEKIALNANREFLRI